jgi:hypothetical protein
MPHLQIYIPESIICQDLSLISQLQECPGSTSGESLREADGYLLAPQIALKADEGIAMAQQDLANCLSLSRAMMHWEEPPKPPCLVVFLT